MISIIKATEKDCSSIVKIGKIAVLDAHKESASAEEMDEYLGNNYNKDIIKEELKDPKNIYHIIKYNLEVAGFTKIILNAAQPDIQQENIAMLDRIYLLKEFYGLKLGYELLKYNIAFCKDHAQTGIWLHTWVGNKRAINFYLRAGFSIVGSHEFKVTETRYNQIHLMLLNFEIPEPKKDAQRAIDKKDVIH